jgi:hypothetical protein
MSLSYLTILNVGGIINCWSIDLVITNVNEAIGDNSHSSSLELSTMAIFFYPTYYSLCGFILAPNGLSKWKS